MNPTSLKPRSVSPKLLCVASLALALIGQTSFAQSLPSPVVSFNFDSQTDTTSGAAAWSANTPSGTGSSLDLSTGAAGYASGSAAEVNGLSSFTISAWINLQADPAANDRIASSLASSLGLDFRISNPSSGTLSASNFGLTLQVNGASNSSSLMGSNRSVNASNQWVFVVATYDSVAQSARFFDGGSSTNAFASALGAGTVPINGGVVGTSSQLQIGATPATSADRTPSTLIDDVRIFNGALTLSEIELVRLDGISPIPEPAHIASLMAILALVTGLTVRRRKSGS
jgi:hypothetical protein